VRRNSAGSHRYDYQEQGYGAQRDRVCGAYLEQQAGEQARQSEGACCSNNGSERRKKERIAQYHVEDVTTFGAQGQTDTEPMGALIDGV